MQANQLHRGFEIRKVGKAFVCLKVYKNGKRQSVPSISRSFSLEAAKCKIDARVENRPFTRYEHSIVYG